MLDQVNVITNYVNINVMHAIINNAFTKQCVIDNGAYLSFLDNEFVNLHASPVTPMRPGAARIFIAAEETKLRAIGTTPITLNFAGKDFPFEFQVVDRLSTNILLGMNFILKYHCVPYGNDAVFALGSDCVRVPMCVKESCLGLAKLKEQVTLESHTQHLVGLRGPALRDHKIYLIELLPNTEGQGFRFPRTIL